LSVPSKENDTSEAVVVIVIVIVDSFLHPLIAANAAMDVNAKHLKICLFILLFLFVYIRNVHVFTAFSLLSHTLAANSFSDDIEGSTTSIPVIPRINDSAFFSFDRGKLSSMVTFTVVIKNRLYSKCKNKISF